MDPPTTEFRTPGQFLNALLAERGWTKRTLAVVLEMDEQKINRISNDKQPVTAEIALLLEEVFGVRAELFLDKQKTYDLAIARLASRPDEGRASRANLYSKLPVTDMIRRGWIKANDIRDPGVEAALARFFKTNRIDDLEALPHAAKKTESGPAISPAQLAWLYRVKGIAMEMHPPRYSAEALSAAIEKFKTFRREADDVRHVPRLLNDAGVRFVVVESIPGALIDGVCFWLDAGAPVIGMSLRFDRIDNFWFVLRHECSHVLHRHGMQMPVIDDDTMHVNDAVSDEEAIANSDAADFCVPTEKLKSFYLRKKPFFTEVDIVSFAKRVDVHPGIAVGQLQRISRQYELHRKLLVKVRSCLSGSMLMDGWGGIVPLAEQGM